MLINSDKASELLTCDELMQILKVSRVTIYRLKERRQIPFYKVGGSIRFDKKDVSLYLQQRGVESIGIK